MKDLKNSTNELSSLQWETKFIYTIFLIFCLISYIIIGTIIATRSGFSSEQAITYYTGNEENDVYGKTFGELIDLTHFHLFSIPLFIFVQGHIFLLSSWQRKIKIIIIVASFFGAALYIAAPWLIVYVSRSLVFLILLSRVLLGLTLLIFLCVPLKEMWFKGRKSRIDKRN